MYFKDQGNATDADLIRGTNSGLLIHSIFTEQSKSVDMEGPIFNDICQQNRYRLDGVQFGVKLWPSNNAFRLMSVNKSANYKVVIEEAMLKACQVDVNPIIRAAHANTIKRGPALYYYNRTDVKAYAIATGQYGITIEDLYRGKVPKRLVVEITDSAGFNGDYKKISFYFDNYNCTFIWFYQEGKSVPLAPLTPNYTQGNYMSAYMTLLCNDSKFGNNISRTEYPKGYCLYMFDLSEDRCEKYGGKTKRGHTHLEIKGPFRARYCRCLRPISGLTGD